MVLNPELKLPLTKINNELKKDIKRRQLSIWMAVF